MRVQLQKRYDATFRKDALAALERTERSLGEVARDLGLPATTLRNWYKDDMAKKGKKAGSPRAASGPSASETVTVKEKLARLEQENNALRKRVDELETDKAILKKAAAFFAKESE